MTSFFDRIFADIRKDVPSVTDAVFRQELFRVMDDFTQVTNLWQEHVLVTTEPAKSIYMFQTVTGRPNRLLTIYADVPEHSAQFGISGVTLFPPSPAYWPTGPATMRIPGALQFRDAQTGVANLRVVVAKRTSEPLTAEKYPAIEEWVVDKYGDTIGRGVLARLQWQPQKPYSNPMLASANQRAYIDGRGVAAANDGNENVYGAQTWRFPQGWSTVNRRGFA